MQELTYTTMAGIRLYLEGRPLMPLLDAARYRPSDQIAIAAELP